MVEHDEQTEQVLNSQFAEYLRNKGASPLDVIVETEPGAAQQIAEEIPGISGAELGTAGIIGPDFVAVSLPSEALPAVTGLRNVVKVHYDQPVGIKEAGRGLPQLPFLRPENDPIGASISNAAFKLANVEDKYVGEVGISEVEAPQVNATPLPPGNPAQAIASGLDHAFGLGITGEEYIPTEESVKWIRDSNMLDAHDGADTKVAVLDTGHTPIPPANGGRSPHLESMVPGEPPQDMHGHGCASPGTKVHTTLTGIDTMKGVWNALSERCEVSDLDAGEDQGEQITDPVMADGHSPPRVQTLDKETGEVEAKPVDEMYRIEVDEDIYKVTLRSGTTIELTPWHPTLVFRDGKIQKVRADELETGDAVLAPDSRDSFYGPPRTLPIDIDRGWYLSKEKAWAVGAFLGDGNARRSDEKSRHEVSLSNNNIEMHKQFAESLSGIGDTARLRAADGAGATAVTGAGVSDPTALAAPEGERLVSTKYGAEVTDFIGEVCGSDVFGQGKSKAVAVPESVENSRESVIGAFLAGLFDADGHVKTEKSTVIYTTSSEAMSKDLVYLLSEVGIDARVGVLTDSRDAEETKAQTGPSYRVIISGGPDLRRFVRLVSDELVSESKRIRLMERLYEADFDHHRVPDKRTVGDARMDPVRDIETEAYTGYFYDFHIEDNHNYVAGKDGFAFISNSWCTYTVAGKPSPSSWGTCQGVAEGAQYGHFKVLNTFPGFGMTSWILKGMERARNWGADVISMSLGGDQQGPLDEDPYARFIRRRCKENAGDDEGSIFVVASGNSGADQWTIGSPGVSEKALTVGAWSMKDAAPSYYSSRGPQGKWYKNRGDDFREDRGSYGYAEFVKPDVVAPGGGRETKAKNDDEGELLHQTSVGWMEGLFDGLKDARGLMKGSSMATPHVAGLVTRLYDAGIVTTAADVKQVARDQGEVRNYPRAAANANVTEQGKNVSVGFGPLKESLFSP